MYQNNIKRDYRNGNYRTLRSYGVPMLALIYDYNELIQKGLVLAIQDNQLTIVDYPTAIRRKLAFDNQSIARHQYKVLSSLNSAR